MLNIVLTTLILIIFAISIPLVIQKRKKLGIRGWKTTITPISFYVIAIINLLAIWMEALGIFTWILTVSLLIIAAYFSRYIPKEFSRK